MGKQIYVNLPVTDLAKSTAFYEALGFTKNPTFSDDNANSMMWSDDIVVMLLKHDFYKRFIGQKQIIDAKQANGGNYYKVDMGMDPNMMFSYEVEDPDGHIWEPVWMNENFDPQATQA